MLSFLSSLAALLVGLFAARQASKQKDVLDFLTKEATDDQARAKERKDEGIDL